MKANYIFMSLMVVLLSACNNVPKYASYDEYPVYEGNDL